MEGSNKIIQWLPIEKTIQIWFCWFKQFPFNSQVNPLSVAGISEWFNNNYMKVNSNKSHHLLSMSKKGMANIKV